MSGGLSWDTFKCFNYLFLINWAIAYVLALFVAQPLASKLCFRLVNPSEGKPFLINLVMSTFMVCVMVSLMSFVGVMTNAIVTNTFSFDIILIYITNVCKAFIFALPLQILVVGPLVRYLFSVIYSRKYAKNSTLTQSQQLTTPIK